MGRKTHLSYKKNTERKKRAKKKTICYPTNKATLQSLISSLELPDGTWSDQSPPNLEKLVVCKIS